MQSKLVGILILGFSFSALAQKDTVYLKEVEITVPQLLKYTYGGNVKILQTTPSKQNLNQLISENTASYFKNYGNGQLSTVTLRGTTAAHTSVIWNGIEVNSPTLGQTDFSQWPTYLLDDISLHLGASSSAFGSGAIGGTILLNQSEPNFEPSRKLNVNLEAGSYGNYTTAATSLVSNHRIVSQTKLFRNSIENNFNIPSENRNQNNAAVLQYGFDQQFYYKINENQLLRLEGLYLFNNREVQPLKFDTNSSNELLNENLRLSLNYRNESGPGTWNTTIGYIINNQRYNISSKTKTNQTTISTNYDLSLGSSSSLKVGLSYSNFVSDVDAFASQINENRIDAFTALNHTINDWWRVSINIRKGYYTDRSFPFVPSIGQEIDLIKAKKQSLKFKSLISKSYRIPTLNDRFWGTVGRPDLLPENGSNVEGGLLWISKSRFTNLEVSLTHYRSWIDELIVWLPAAGDWFPQNNRRVNTSGFEVFSKWSKEIAQGKITAQLNYNYTKSTNKKGLSEIDQTGVNKQLPYVPFHTGNISLKLEKKGWTISSFFEYVGNRFTTFDNSQFNSVEAFELLDLSISKSFEFNTIKLSSYFKLNNVLNKEYENFKNYAMPQRNFLLGINLNL